MTAFASVRHLVEEAERLRAELASVTQQYETFREGAQADVEAQTEAWVKMRDQRDDATEAIAKLRGELDEARSGRDQWQQHAKDFEEQRNRYADELDSGTAERRGWERACEAIANSVSSISGLSGEVIVNVRGIIYELRDAKLRPTSAEPVRCPSSAYDLASGKQTRCNRFVGHTGNCTDGRIDWCWLCAFAAAICGYTTAPGEFCKLDHAGDHGRRSRVPAKEE